MNPSYAGAAGINSPRYAESDAPRATTAIEDIQNRLRGLRDEADKLLTRITSAADRAQGNQPSPGASTNGLKAAAIQGAVQETIDITGDIARLLGNAHEQFSRIETVV